MQRDHRLDAAPPHRRQHVAIAIDRRRIPHAFLRFDAAPLDRQAMRVGVHLRGEVQVLFKTIAPPIARLAGFLIAGQTSWAVDKVERKSGSTQLSRPPAAKPNAPKPAAPAPKQVTPPPRPTSPKKPDPPKRKYDDFIDKNHNGIDDRQEKPSK